MRGFLVAFGVGVLASLAAALLLGAWLASRHRRVGPPASPPAMTAKVMARDQAVAVLSGSSHRRTIHSKGV